METGVLELERETYQSILLAADRLQFDQLRDACLSYARHTFLNPKGCTELVKLARRYNDRKLLQMATSYACLNFADVPSSALATLRYPILGTKALLRAQQTQAISYSVDPCHSQLP